MLHNSGKLIIFTAIFSISNAIDYRSNTCKNFYSYPFRTFSKDCYYNPDVYSTASNLITRHGFVAESYKAVTVDGNFLTLFRVRRKGNATTTKIQQPVFLQHGALVSATGWLVHGNKSLPFKLAEQNYDVWLGNFRGTQYSREHLYKSYREKNFWNYNIDTLAKFDLPALLSFVKRTTNSSCIYIGHSMGTTTAFMFASENPKEAAKLMKGIVALSPIVYLTKFFSIPKQLSSAIKFFVKFFRIRGLPFSEGLHEKIYLTCGIFPYICYTILKIGGDFTGQFSPESLLILARIFPDSMSIDELSQYLQIMGSKEFKKFDYGPVENVKMYGQARPPMYNLTNVELPAYLFYGKNDKLTSEKAISRLFHELGSKEKFVTEVPKNNEKFQFNHFNFIWSKDIEEYLYKDLFELLRNKFK